MKILYLENLETFAEKMAGKIKDIFVLKEPGKTLSTNDYTEEDKNKVENIPADYIVSGSQTEASEADGGANVYTFVGSNGKTSAFTVKNGSKGSQGAKGAKGDRGSRWGHGTAITGASTSPTAFPASGITDALANDYYLNTSTGNIYRCTTPGNAQAAKWAYAGNMKGPGGETGGIDEITEEDINRIIAGTYGT